MVDFYGFHVGKYTVRPMDASWVMENHLENHLEVWASKSTNSLTNLVSLFFLRRRWNKVSAVELLARMQTMSEFGAMFQEGFSCSISFTYIYIHIFIYSYFKWNCVSLSFFIKQNLPGHDLSPPDFGVCVVFFASQ